MRYTLAVLIVVSVASSAPAMFANAPDAPVERLIGNVQAYIDAHPDDAEGYFTLARVHYIAFAQKTPAINAFGEGGADKLPDVTDERIQWHRDEQRTLDEPALVHHAREAIRLFHKAIELEPKKAAYHLGLAGILTQAMPYARQIGSPVPGVDEKADASDEQRKAEWRERAIAENLKAYRLGRAEALKVKHVLQPFWPVAYEAGTAYLKLVAERGIKPEESKTVKKITADIKAIAQKPQAITPIVFSLTGRKRLNDLLAAGTLVSFDLDGDGVAERRPWVRPDTCILVWDPAHTGAITSGRQLFGSVTWFVLWTNGYRALDALDDNRDGKLSGGELSGLAIWRDANCNAVSEPREVTPVVDAGITSIATASTAIDEGCAAHPRGLTTSDGRTLPTWDWIVR